MMRFFTPLQPEDKFYPQGLPLRTLGLAFAECRGYDKRIQRVGGQPFDRDVQLDDLDEVLAFWYDGGRDYADEEICVLASTGSPRFHYYLIIEASSDSSGWGCQQSMSVTVGDDLDELIRLGMSKKYRIDLGYENNDGEVPSG